LIDDIGYFAASAASGGRAMRRWATTVATATALLGCAGAAHAQSDIKTVGDLAKKCISDDRSPCAKFIIDSVGALEAARQTRGEPSCLAGDPSQEQIVKTFIRALLAKYAYSDLSPAAAVETIYRDNCGRQN
jgi:hypothetical protein